MRKPEPEFCPAPFTQLQLQPNGDVVPCCWNEGHVLGNIREKTLAEIWDGPGLQALRQEFTNGRIRSCREQIRRYRCHRYIAAATELRTRPADPLPASPRRLYLRLNGQCNLECVMCTVWQEPNGSYDESHLWTEGPARVFPALEEIDLVGGEPLIQKDTFRLIREVSAVNSRCTWGITTNGQWRWNSAVASHLDRIHLRFLQLSLDSLDPETYASIRRKGSLEKSLATLDSMIRYRDLRSARGESFCLRVSFCIQAANWREIPQLLRFAREKGLRLVLQYLEKPDRLSLSALPAEERRRIIGMLKEQFDLTQEDALLAILLPLRSSLLEDGLAVAQSAHALGQVADLRD